MAVNALPATPPLLTLAQAAARIPSRPNLSTLWRWCTKGIDGVRLQHVRIGRKILVDADSLDTFFRASAAAAIQRLDARHAAARPKPAKTRTAKRRQRDIEAAKAVVYGDQL